MTVTLSELKSRARQAADMENSTFIGDTELLRFINGSYQELYDLIIDTYEDYYVTSESFTLATADAGVRALSATFYKLRGLDYLQGGQYMTVMPYNWNDRNTYANTVTWPALSGLAYRLMGSNLRLEPYDNSDGTYRLWYVPTLTKLSADADVVDSIITRAGWEEFIVVDAARKMRQKEESSVDTLVTEKKALIQRIMAAAVNRDADQAFVISDSRRDEVGYYGR